MTDKKKKYQPEPEDMHKNGRLNRQLFVARIVNTEDRALNAREVHALMNKKVEPNRGRTHIQTQANLADAVKSSLIDKTRVQISETRTGVVYHPTNMKPMGLDIPIPAHTRTPRLTQQGKPDAVKVAEKVIADIAGLPTDADLEEQLHRDFGQWKHTPIDEEVFRVKHKKDEPVMKFDAKKLVDALEEEEKKRLAGLSSTIQHHFTAEQLLDTLNNLNPDLHDDVLIAVYEALGKPVYIGLTHDFTKPQSRKTEHMSWAFVSGNLVVKQ